MPAKHPPPANPGNATGRAYFPLTDDYWTGCLFFLLPRWTSAPDIHLYTDSSGAISFGAFYDGEWFNGCWSPSQAGQSIHYKELYLIVITAATWGQRLSMFKVRFHCNNCAVLSCISSGTSHCPHTMHSLCHLLLICALHKFVSACHIPGTEHHRRHTPPSGHAGISPPRPHGIPQLPFTHI